MIRRCGILAVVAALVLAAAAVWFGGLNQDEGWYLYAAQLVREGRFPYRDFFYTQGPVLPIVYAALTGCWTSAGLLGARLLTLGFGLVGLAVTVGTVRLIVPAPRRAAAGVLVFLLLGCNLYHLYYLAIPKTYALASLFVQIGFLLLARALCRPGLHLRALHLALAGLALALAAGTRISLGLLLAVIGSGLLFGCGRFGLAFLWFGLGGALGLALVYGPFLLDPAARDGIAAAQVYHAMRGGFSPVFAVGSLSRLVRWYAPLFALAVLACAPFAVGAQAPSGEECSVTTGARATILFAAFGFLAVFAVQVLAPFPYEDYQVPVMALAALAITAALVRRASEDALPRLVLLTLALAFATAFGSPLLEQWKTNGQDRLWTRMKSATELEQLRSVAAEIERLDPGGKTLLTQDLYLAIETNRRVPEGLEMGPFSILSDEAWRTLLATVSCPVAAASDYTFAIDPPRCTERDGEEQDDYWHLLYERYEELETIPDFGQHATTLRLLRLKKEAAR